MRRFIYGNDGQFEWLRRQIEGALYIFNDISLPGECAPSACRLGFEFTPEAGYRLYIDKNIAYAGRNGRFRDLLTEGEAAFETYDALVAFIRGLASLYKDSSEAGESMFFGGLQSGGLQSDGLLADYMQAAACGNVPPPDCSPVEIDCGKLREGLASKIIGQDEAMADLADAVQIHLAQIKPERPATIFMAGPTGVGKTESVNALADTLNQLTDAGFTLIRVDCNQYMESHRVSQLLGSPHGYIGYGEPTVLAPLAANPRCIVLWDEIEKAHANVLKALMSAMDTGKMQLPTQINGKSELDCRRSIFVFTSNLSLKNPGAAIGFSGAGSLSALPASVEDRCKEALVKNGIGLEIAGRIAWFMQFKPLTEQDVAKVIRREVERCADSFGIKAERISDAIINELIRSTGSKFGMRAYKQLISRKFGKILAPMKDKPKAISISGSLDELKIEY